MQAQQVAVARLAQDAMTAGLQCESARLQALDGLDILETPQEEAFDRISRLAKKLFGVPIVVISFMDAHRQWFKSAQGLTGQEAPREHTFCRRVVEDGQSIIVPDATQDARFAQNPYVLGEPCVRFYAGIPLKTSDGLTVGTMCLVDFEPREFPPAEVEIMSDLAQLVMDELDLRLCATKDSLTGALSRRAFKSEASRASALALRHHHALSAIALDLDHFKSVNDTFGHAGGDVVLARTVQICTEQLRDTDLIGRLGGEEFAALLPNTSLGDAMEVAEKLRNALAQSLITFDSQEIRVTASFGVAALDPSTRDADALLDHADKALYEAKEAGRNRCVAWRAPANEITPRRRRVLKGGLIVFNDGKASMDCTVRSLSDEGAGLDVSNSVGVPKRFNLLIRADDFEKPCRIVLQTEKHIEAAFC